jgi:hypothetical protein
MFLFEFVCFQKKEETKPSQLLSLLLAQPSRPAFFSFLLNFPQLAQLPAHNSPAAHQIPPTHSNLSLSHTLTGGLDPPVRVVPDLPPAERHPVATQATASPVPLPLPRASSHSSLVRHTLTRRRPAPSSSSPSRNGRPPKLHRALMVAAGVPPPTASGAPSSPLRDL